MAPGDGLLRLTRVTLFALTAVGLTSAAHVAGGERFSPLVAALAVPMVMLVVHRMAGRRRGLLELVAGMSLVQVLLHVGMMIASARPICAPAGGSTMTGAMTGAMTGTAGPGVAGHAHLMACAGGSGPIDGSSAVHLLPSTPMLVAHLLATLVLASALAYGEQVVWALAAALGLRLVRPGPAMRIPAWRPLPVRGPGPARRPGRTHRRSHRRRGPPRLLGA